jgi:hypothetical protein
MALGGCQKDAIVIDNELIGYLDRFMVEANVRGYKIDMDRMNLEINFTSTLVENVSGQCTHNTTKPNQVEISSSKWTNLNELQKEYLMFHELGHCILKRSHLDTKDELGRCKSIMESGVGRCHQHYTATNRSSMLDELFKN